MTRRQRSLYHRKLYRAMEYIRKQPTLFSDADYTAARFHAYEILRNARRDVWMADIIVRPPRVPRAFVATNGRGTAFGFEDNDCVVRALSTLCELPYGAAHRACEIAGRGRGMAMRHIDLMKATANWTRFANYSMSRVCFTGPISVGRLLRQIKKEGGRYMVRVLPNGNTASGHVFAVIDGKMFDDTPNDTRLRVDDLWRFDAL